MRSTWGVNDPEAVKLWAKRTDQQVLKKAWVGQFIGTGSDSLCQLREDLTKSAGDRIRTILRLQLSAPGVQGNNTLEGAEEALITYTDDLLIDNIRHAVISGGKMSEQRVPFSVREEARLGLQDWHTDRLDYWFFNQISGNTAQTNTLYTGNQAVSAPDTSHWIFANSKGAESSLSVSDTFSLAYVDQCVLKARTLPIPIRECNTGSKQAKYVMFITPEQHYDLRRTTATNDYYDIQQAALQGGQTTDNPIFTGAIGLYNSTILHEAYRLPVAVLSNNSNGTATNGQGRAVFCGAQAASLAYGSNGTAQRLSWVEKYFDYQDKLGVAAGYIAGLKKLRYNSKDFGTIVVSTAHSNAATSSGGR